jgi:hypothetical protein
MRTRAGRVPASFLDRREVLNEEERERVLGAERRGLPPQLLPTLGAPAFHGVAHVHAAATLANCANGIAYTWVIDVREPSNPVSIATLPTPAEEDFCKKGGKFGPHNLHENRPGSLQTEDLVFATYHNAGLRIYDVREPHQPKQVGYFVPPPERIVDQRPNPAKVIQSCDVYVDANGVMYVIDTNAGLYILQYEGP